MELMTKQRYKQTEVGMIPADWQLIGLGAQSTLKARIGWQGLTTAEYLDSGDYYLITGTDFEDGKIKWDTCHYVTRDRYLQDRNIQLKKEDILITKDGTIGKAAYVDDVPLPATLNSGVFVIRPKNDAYHPRYCFYVFRSAYFDDFLNKLVAGSTINHLYQKDFVSFVFPAPDSKIEQQAIATALSDADVLIAGLEKLIAKKRNIKQGAMQELLSPKEGWEEKPLTEVVNYIHGKAHEQYVSDDGRYVLINSKFISTEGEIRKYTDVNFCMAKRNDITTVLSDLPNGKALAKCYFIEEDNKYAVNQRICIWRSKGANERFLFYLLNRNKYFLGFDDGVSQTHILNRHIEECKVSIPLDCQQQKEIGETLFSMDKELDCLEQKLEKYKQMKQGMMQQLLTGRIRLV